MHLAEDVGLTEGTARRRCGGEIPEDGVEERASARSGFAPRGDAWWLARGLIGYPRIPELSDVVVEAAVSGDLRAPTLELHRDGFGLARRVLLRRGLPEVDSRDDA